MTVSTFHMRRQHEGRPAGTVRVQAESIRDAFDRVRARRPDYARDRLIVFGIQEGKR